MLYGLKAIFNAAISSSAIASSKKLGLFPSVVSSP
jgi:hypothetical protein